MSSSDLFQLEPTTWKRFLIFLLAVVGILLCFSMLAPLPRSGTPVRYQISD